MQTWIYLVIALAGFTMGMLFEIPFVIAFSIALAVTMTAIAVAEGWPALSALYAIGASLLVLQAAYLLGVMVSAAWNKKLRKRRP